MGAPCCGLEVIPAKSAVLQAPGVFALLSEVLPATQLKAMSTFTGKVTFDTFWKHIEAAPFICSQWMHARAA